MKWMFTEIPSLVFFNQNIEEEGIKISGLYPYEVYVQILDEMLEGLPEPSSPPSLEEFVSCFKLVATKEIEAVYNMRQSYRGEGNEKACFKTSGGKNSC